MSASAFERYIAPARKRGAWWRVLLSLVIVCGIWFLWGMGLIRFVLAGGLQGIGIGRENAAMFGAAGRLMQPPGVVLFLLTFLGLWIGLWAALRLLHRRRFMTLFHPQGRILRRDIGAGVALVVTFHAIGLLAYSLSTGLPQRTDLALTLWAVWLVPVILAICLQATAEELLFRGYLLQQFAIWSRNPLVWAVVPGVVFTALHYDPAMDPMMRSYMLVHIFGFALVAAAAVWRTGSLWLASSIHVTNNILSISAFGIEENAFGFELFVFAPDVLERMVVFDIAMTGAMMAAILLLFRKPGEDTP